MRKFFLPAAVLVLIFSFVPAKSQTISSPDKNRPVFPSIAIQALDSSTIIQTEKIAKDKPVILLFFNTTCEHCQKAATDLVVNRDKLRKVQVVMMSTENITLIKEFCSKYSLSKIANVIIGRDYQYGGSRYYGFESYPYCVIYSRIHVYIKSFERNFDIEDILQGLRKNREL